MAQQIRRSFGTGRSAPGGSRTPAVGPTSTVQEEAAHIFYFTHAREGQRVPEAIPGVIPYALRNTSLQVAQLHLRGDTLTCDRDAPFDFQLGPPADALPAPPGRPTPR